jgi:NAD(P)-dependent dehydrogenase (short-subunit alcohol dehydrogenase family)
VTAAVDFSGKVGLVTGAGRGIGRESALAFARLGAAVGVLDVLADEASATVAAIEAEGGRAIALAVDVSSEAQVSAAVDDVVAHFGPLDFAHNNAGIMGAVTLLHELDLADWEATLAVNLRSVFLCMKHELRQLLPRGGGAIVNTSSNAGVASVPNMPDYVASKHGVVGLTRSAARDYSRHGIRVNAICPGWTQTPLMDEFTPGADGDRLRAGAIATTPMGRIGGADEVASAAVWLCSDAASYVTGIAMSVDGGRRA